MTIWSWWLCWPWVDIRSLVIGLIDHVGQGQMWLYEIMLNKMCCKFLMKEVDKFAWWRRLTAVTQMEWVEFTKMLRCLAGSWWAFWPEGDSGSWWHWKWLCLSWLLWLGFLLMMGCSSFFNRSWSCHISDGHWIHLDLPILLNKVDVYIQQYALNDIIHVVVCCSKVLTKVPYDEADVFFIFFKHDKKALGLLWGISVCVAGWGFDYLIHQKS